MTSAKRGSIVLPLAGVSVMLALAIATQQVASVFHYPQAFGRGLFDVGATRIYAPWAFVGWYVRFARSYQQTFDLAAMIALAVALLPAMMAIGLTRGAQRQPRKFGQDAWAGLVDAQKAKLLGPSRHAANSLSGGHPGDQPHHLHRADTGGAPGQDGQPACRAPGRLLPTGGCLNRQEVRSPSRRQMRYPAFTLHERQWS